MPTIEQRVVEMRFDNKQFEDNAQQSIKTIDKLNDSLDFKNAGASLDKISEAGKRFNLTGMEMALSTVTEKFSALEIAGITAIQNITNRAVNMGTNFIKANTIDQLSAGWSKYAQKTSAVQTIMAATAKNFSDQGQQMEYVNEQIEKLNWFTDETSYSLLDMTSNIGKFTSNGIALDKSVTAMQGISTWASISGATISDAGRAMYNLSQAMATGSVKLIDWKSIENANMATAEFKEMAIQAAVAEGTLKKVGDAYQTCGDKVKKTGLEVSANNFNENLSAEWFTADVLMKTLDKYGSFTEQLYDFMNISELDTASQAIKMIDDYAAGTLDLAEAADDAGISADELEKHLKKLASDEYELGRRSFKAAQEAKTFQEAIDSVAEAVSSGWMQSFEYIFGNYLEAKNLWTNVANELYDVFAASAYDRNQILKFWHKNGGYELFLEGLNNLWSGLKNIAAPIKDAWAAVFEPFYNKSYDETIEGKAGILITFTQKFADVTEKFRDYIGDWTKTWEDIMTPVEEVAEPIKNAAESVEEVVSTIARTEAKLSELANAVIRGDYGNGQARVEALRAEGYSYEMVQNEVNRLLGFEYRRDILAEDLAEHEQALAAAEEAKQKAQEKSVETTQALNKAEADLSQVSSKSAESRKNQEREALAEQEASAQKNQEINKKLGDEQKKLAEENKKSLDEMTKAHAKSVQARKQNERDLMEVEETNEKKRQNINKQVSEKMDEYESARRAGILRSAFIGVFEALNIVKTAAEDTFGLVGHVVERTVDVLEGPFWNALDNITDWFETVRENTDIIQDIHNFFGEVTKIVDKAFDTIEHFFKKLSNNEGIKRLGSSLVNLGQMFGRVFGKIFGQLGEWSKSDGFWDSIGTVLDWLVDKIGDVADFIAGAIDMVTSQEDNITNFLKVFADNTPGIISTLATSFTDLYDAVSKIGGTAFAKIGEIFGNLFGLINEQFTNPESSLNSISGNVVDIFGKFIEKLQTFDINNLGDLLKGGGIAAIGYGIYQFIKTIVDGLKETKKIPDNINSLLETTKGVIKSYQREINVDMVYKLAKSIGIFAASMVGLSLLNEEDLKRVSAALIPIMGMFALIISQMAKMQAKKDVDGGGLVDKILEPIKGFLNKIGDAFKNLTKIAGIGIGIVAFSAAVIMLADLAVKLISIPWDQFMNGIGKMAVVAGMLGFCAIVLSNMASQFQVKQGLGLVLFAASINMLIPPLMVLSMLPIGKMITSIGGLLVIMSSFSLLAEMLDGADLVGTGFGLIMFAAAIDMLTIPVMTFALIPVTKLLFAVTGVVALIAALTAMALMLDGNNSAMELIGIAAAMTIMMIPLMVVGKNAMTCAAGLLVLVAGFAALAVIGGIAQSVSLGLIVLAAAAIGFGAGATLFGVGCLAIAAGIYLVVKTIPLIFEALVQIGTAIKEHGVELAIGFAAILAAIAFAIIASSPTISAAIGSLIGAAAAAVSGALPVITSHLFVVIMGLLAFLYTVAPEVINGILDILVATLHALADGIRNHAAPIFSAIGDLLDASFDMIVEFVASVADMIPVVGKKIGDKIRGAKDWVDPEAGAEIGETLKEQATESVKGAGAEIQGQLNTEMDQVDASEATEPIAEDLASSLKENIASMDVSPDILNALTGVVDQNGGIINAFGVDLSGLITSGFAENMLQNAEMPNAAEQSIDTAVDAASEEASKEAPKSGNNFDDGVVSGIYEGEQKLSDAGKWAAGTVNSSFQETLKINSPSKVGMENGMFWDEGIALGLINNAGIISDASEKTANTVMDTMRNIIGNISSMLESDMDLNPTITPVLDLSNLQNGASAINGMFGNRSLNLAASNGIRFEANRLEALNKLETQSTNADVVAALGLLRGDVNNLNDSFANTQVVLDSGALVGATAKQMDNALGRIKVYKGRGI